MVDWEIVEEEDSEVQSWESPKNKQFRHILKHAEHYLEAEQLDIKLADGTVKMPWLVMAAMSPLFKDYWSYINESTIMEPLVLIPDLNVEDFKVFKYYVFHSSELTNACVNIVKSVFEHLGCIFNENIEANQVKKNPSKDLEDVKEEPKKRSKPKKIPAILSRSSFGRSRRLPKRVSPDFSEEEDAIDAAETYDGESVEDIDGKFKKRKSRQIGMCNSRFLKVFFILGNQAHGSLSCRYCSKTYAQIKARNKHMIGEHLEECKRDDAYYPCDSCSAIFVSSLGKEKHFKRIHPVRTKVDASNTIYCPFENPPLAFEK